VAKKRKTNLTPAERRARIGLPEPTASEELILPVGLTKEDGTLITTATVRASNGGDRKAAAAGKARRSGAHITTAFLSRCVEMLGGERPTVPLLRRLSEPDRNFLLLEIRKQTWPDAHTMVATSECQHADCGEKSDFTVDLDEVKIVRVDPEWQEGLPTFTEKSEELGVEVKFHYLLGGDFESIALKYSQQGRMEANPIEMNDDMLLAMIMEVNGHSIDREDLEIFEAPYLSFFEESIEKHKAGPDLAEKGKCSACNRSVDVQVDILDFLLRGQAKKE